MDVTIRGDNFRVTDAIENYARKKLDRLDRYLPNIMEVWVDLTRENSRRGDDVHVAQITIRHQRGAILRAEEKVSGDIQIAINQAVDKLYRQIQRFKSKRSRKGTGRFVATLEELDEAEAIPDMEEFVEENAQSVIRRKDVTITAMDEEEAIEQMELLDHTFFMFYSTTTGSVNVVYKRANGGYGVLVPHVE